MDSLILAIDQGTSSSRVIIFSATQNWAVICQHQVEFESFYPEEGWCEQDPLLLLDTVKKCIIGAVEKLVEKGGTVDQIKAVGITNQRETTVAWDKSTGKPLHNALVWHDARTKHIVDEIIAGHPDLGQDLFKDKCGLQVSTYFSAVKMKWLLENVPEVKEANEKGQLMFGNVDAWLIWNLTDEQVFVTDVSNASRTMLMDLKKLEWSQELCHFFGVDMQSLPEIRSSAEIYGRISLSGLSCPISGCLGDQQAALVGQKCLHPGMAKNTYGTGCFLLYNVGQDVVYSTHGLLSTVAYQLGKDEPPTYALEGSIANCGSAVAWLKSLGIISSPQESQELAAKVEDTGEVYFVPAFNGLFAPHWRPDARGTIVGLTNYTRREHICRATLEAVAFQVYEILLSMAKDSGQHLKGLLVDGGMTRSDLLMQIQADFTGIPVKRPRMAETTSLGAALAAASTLGLWKLDNESQMKDEYDLFQPQMEAVRRDRKFERWTEAIERSLNWEKQ